MLTIIGGKYTTYRAVAEKAAKTIWDHLKKREPFIPITHHLTFERYLNQHEQPTWIEKNSHQHPPQEAGPKNNQKTPLNTKLYKKSFKYYY